MRLLLGIALLLLFLWLHKAQTSSANFHASTCETVSMSKATASLLLSPLSLYSWLVSTLLRLVLSVPALVLGALWHSLLLLLALPWCVAAVGFHLLLAGLYATLYLLHLALVAGAVAILIFGKHKMADRGTTSDEGPERRGRVAEHRAKTTRLAFGRRLAQQG